MSGAEHLPGGVARHAAADVAGDLRDAADPVRARDRVVRGAGAARPAGRHRGVHLGDLPGGAPLSEPGRPRVGLRGDAARSSRPLGVYFASRLSARGSAIRHHDRQGVPPAPIDLGAWRWLTAAIFIVYFLLIVVLPFSVLLWSSFQRFYAVPSMEALQNLTLDPYRFILELSEPARTVLNSVVLSFGSATIVMLVTVGDLLDRGEDQAAGPLAARQHRVAADGVSRARARASRS